MEVEDHCDTVGSNKADFERNVFQVPHRKVGSNVLLNVVNETNYLSRFGEILLLLSFCGPDREPWALRHAPLQPGKLLW